MCYLNTTTINCTLSTAKSFFALLYFLNIFLTENSFEFFPQSFLPRLRSRGEAYEKSRRYRPKNGAGKKRKTTFCNKKIHPKKGPPTPTFPLFLILTCLPKKGPCQTVKFFESYFPPHVFHEFSFESPFFPNILCVVILSPFKKNSFRSFLHVLGCVKL